MNINEVSGTEIVKLENLESGSPYKVTFNVVLFEGMLMGHFLLRYQIEVSDDHLISISSVIKLKSDIQISEGI